MFWLVNFITLIIFLQYTVSDLPGLQYNMSGPSKKCIIFCLNFSETAGRPISILIPSLDFELGERLNTSVVNTLSSFLDFLEEL